MNKEIKIKITPDGKVEIDSTVFTDCKDVAAHFTKILGNPDVYNEKDDIDIAEEIKIRQDD